MKSLINWKPLKNVELEPNSSLLLLTSSNTIIAGLVHPNDPDLIMISKKYGLKVSKLATNYMYSYQSDIEYFNLQ